MDRALLCRGACGTMAALALAAGAAQAAPTSPAVDDDATRLLAEAHTRAGLGFEPNRGQLSSDALFYARALDYEVALLKDGSLVQAALGAATRSHMALLGAHPGAPQAEHELPGITTYTDAAGPAATGVHAFERVTYRNVYPGVSATYHGRAGAVEYDFTVAPGADPRAIRLSFGDARRVSLDAASGDLLITDRAGNLIRHARPDLYQLDDTGRHAVAGGFRLRPHHVVQFEVGSYDRAQPLIIDPTISLTRFLSGSRMDLATAVTVDAAGNTYVAGLTAATVAGFPTRSATYAPGPKDAKLQSYLRANFPVTSAFIVKLDASGNITNTILFGGTGYTQPNALAVDDYYVYVAGLTNSPAMITASGQSAYVTYNYGTPPAQTSESRAFLAKFTTPLTSLGQVITLSALGSASANGLYVDQQTTYLTGTACGTGFPTTATAWRRTPPGICNVFVTKLDALGTLTGQYGPVYSTYYGGSVHDYGNAIAVDATGAAWVAGTTCSADFAPASNGSHGTPGTIDSYGSPDCAAFLLKMDPTGSTYQNALYYGGSGSRGSPPLGEVGNALVLDGSGGAFIAGLTLSRNLYIPTVAGHPAVQSTNPSGCVASQCQSGFIAYVNAAFNVQYATYLGGTNASKVSTLARNARGDLYVGGSIARNSTGFPGAPSMTFNPMAGFVSKLSSTLDLVGWTQLLGDEVTGLVARNTVGNTTLWTVGSRIQPGSDGSDPYALHDAFLVKMIDPTIYTLPTPPPVCRVCVLQ